MSLSRPLRRAFARQRKRAVSVTPAAREMLKKSMATCKEPCRDMGRGNNTKRRRRRRSWPVCGSAWYELFLQHVFPLIYTCRSGLSSRFLAASWPLPGCGKPASGKRHAGPPGLLFRLAGAIPGGGLRFLIIALFRRMQLFFQLTAGMQGRPSAAAATAAGQRRIRHNPFYNQDQRGDARQRKHHFKQHLRHRHKNLLKAGASRRYGRDAKPPPDSSLYSFVV